MATIILNGVENDTNPLEGTTDLNDKLTVSGGLEGYEADMQGGSDLVEIDQAGEDVSDTTIDGGDDDDLIVVDSSSFEAVSNSATLAGGLGDDTTLIGIGEVEGTEAGLVTFSGRAAGNEGDDVIEVARADGATVQAGPDADIVELGSYYAVDVPGSRGDSTIVDTSANGGSGDDVLDVLDAAKLTNSTVNGGSGYDTIYVDGSVTGTSELGMTETGTVSADSVIKTGDEKDKILIGAYGDDASLVNTLINGNAGPDWIKAYGELESTEGSMVSGAVGHDTIDVAMAGPMTVKGGPGKDMLRVGSGQTVVGGDNADTFSIEYAGGVTIEDFDAVDNEDCFCSDVIQVDGNKITYDTYIYKPTKEKYTSASSYAGNIKVKAFEEPTTCFVGTEAEIFSQKSAQIDASAYVKYKATEYKPYEGKTVNYGSTINGNPLLGLPASSFATPSFPLNFEPEGGMLGLNGNSPRPTNTVLELGYGAGVVTGYVIERGLESGVSANGNYRKIQVPNLTAYTYTSFEKGDFSFLDENILVDNSCYVTQTLKFDDVTRGTITNHWVNFGIAKTTEQRSLYDLALGTANFYKVMTGKANLVITKNLEDTTYYPTPDQITNNALVADGVIGNINQTADGKYFYTRTNKATANAVAQLTLSSGTFTLQTRRNDGVGVVFGDIYTASGTYSDESQFAIQGFGEDDGYISWGNVSWNQAQGAGLLTLTVATAVDGSVQNLGADPFTPAMNTLGKNVYAFNTTFFNGSSGGVSDTRTAKGKLTAKIRIEATTENGAFATLPDWLGRAQIKGVEFNPETCYYPSSLTYNIANGFSDHAQYTPASVAPSEKGEFGTKYLWASSGYYGTNTAPNGAYAPYGVKLNSPIWTSYFSEFWSSWSYTDINPINQLEYSNGCPTSSGVKPLSCTGTRFTSVWSDYSDWERFNAYDAIMGTGGLVDRAAYLGNNAFFSASQFTPVALAAEGMGFYATDAEGAPFRVLFMDTAGSDNGLYVMSGTANYKNGEVTAINTNPTASSAMGGKQTIVNVTGGKGFEISLSDINFV